MSDAILKSDTVLPEDLIKNIDTYLDEMMRFKRDQLIVLQDSVIPSVMMIKYEKYKELADTVSTDVKIKTQKGSKEIGMLLAVRSKIHFFYELKDDEILSLVRSAKFIKHQKGEHAFKQGEFGKEIYFIINGSVDIVMQAHNNDKKTVLNSLGEGSVFGEIGPLLGEARTATAVMAAENNLLLAIEFVETPDDSNAAAYVKMTKNFIRALSRKLIQTNEMVYNL